MNRFGHGPVWTGKPGRALAKDAPVTLAPPPREWLIVQTSAVLEAVATSNYACYGRGGVPHYPQPRPAPDADAGPTLCIELFVRDAAGAARLALLDLTLTSRETLDQQAARQVVTWTGYDAERRIQVVWVWDFYRILSHVMLRAAVPPAEVTPGAAWTGAHAAVRAIVPGDALAISVRSACGDIRQRHTLQRPAQGWTPGALRAAEL